MAIIIGRKKEQEELRRLYQSGKAEFVVVYGRRRVGKTYLVREFFDGKLDFHHTGLSPLELEGSKLQEKQLQSFYFSLKRYGADADRQPADWLKDVATTGTFYKNPSVTDISGYGIPDGWTVTDYTESE